MRGKEVFTLLIDGGEYIGEINDPRGMCSYPTMDAAIDAGKEVWNEYIDHYPELAVSVCFNEYEQENGDIYGEPVTLSLQDFGIEGLKVATGA